MTIHSVFDETAGNPAAVARLNDGNPSIILGNAFYTFADADGWYCTGGKLYVFDEPGLITSITLSAWQATPPDTNPDFGGVPLRSAVISSPVEGWNEVSWEPLLMENVSVAGQCTIIAYTCAGAPNAYFAGSGLSADAIIAFDNSDVAMAEQPFPRGYFKIGTDPTSGASTYYGVDIVVDTDPDSGGDMDPILLGSGSINDQIMAGLISQGFTTGTIADRERGRLLAKLELTEPQSLSLNDLYSRAEETPRIH